MASTHTLHGNAFDARLHRMTSRNEINSRLYKSTCRYGEVAPCDLLQLGYVHDTCCRYSGLVFAVLGERYIPRQGHPVHLRQLSSLMSSGYNAFGPAKGHHRCRSTQQMWSTFVREGGVEAV